MTATTWVVPPDCPLTERQLEVLAWMGTGRTQEETATKLYLHHESVRRHVHNARIVLNVTTTIQAVVKCIQRGWFGWRFVPAPDAPVPVTRFERVYGDAFDEYLHGLTDESRHAMSIALLGMRHDRRVAHKPFARPVDPTERLARVLLGEW